MRRADALGAAAQIEIVHFYLRIVLKLSHITVTTEKFKYRSWVEKIPAEKKFYGRVCEDAFELVPFIGGRNFCTPVFKGSVGTAQGETLVTVTPTASRDDLWSLIITQIVLAVTVIVCTLSALDHTFSMDSVFSLIVALGLAGTFGELNSAGDEILRFAQNDTFRRESVKLG